MSEIKRGVMGMPYEMTMDSELFRRQFYAIAREVYAENESLRKDAELHAQIQRAAGELPIGWEIRVCVEHESGYVELWDKDGCEVDFPNSCESLGLTVSDAIDAALGQGEQS